ncbi:MAG: biotin transporter BioY [Candidatus Heimdallarchaeota archaeon]
MNTTKPIFPYQNNFENLIKWSKEQKLIIKFALSIVFACLTGILAQMRFYLPWTPVPVTLQTIAVFGSGLILGPIFGGFSQLLYLLLGIVGVNWFANYNGGINAIVGPTGGYLIGFVIASLIAGVIREKLVQKESKRIVVFIALIGINFIVIYGLGIIQLSLWYWVAQEQVIPIGQLLLKGFVPFIIGDVLKLLGITIYMKY